MQLLQCGPRLDAQLLGVEPATVAVGGERVGLPADGGQGEHELPPQPVPQRVPLHRLGQLVDQVSGQAETQLDVDALLQHREPLLVEGLGPPSYAADGDAGQRRAAPQRQAGPVVPAGLGGATVVDGGPGGVHGAGEDLGVQVLRPDPGRVADGVGDDRLRRQAEPGEPLAQPRHAGLQLARAVAGGRSSHTASTSSSTATTRLARSSSTARTVRSRPAETVASPPPTRSGPRI